MTANRSLFSQLLISSRRRLRLPSGQTEGAVWPGNPLTPLSTKRDFPSLPYLFTCCGLITRPTENTTTTYSGYR